MRYQDWSKFKIHCSGIGDIMSLPRNVTDLTKSQLAKQEKLLLKEDRTEKDNETLEIFRQKRARFLNPPLSETAKSYLVRRYSKEKYNKRVAPVTKQKSPIIKGTALEDEAVKIISDLHKIDYFKPLEVTENDFMTGKCDILCESHGKIVEIKLTWSAETFFPYLKGQLPKKTWFQAQGYMELYDLDYTEVCYVLVNTPQHLIDQEYANLFKRYTFGEISREKYEDGVESLEGFYNYDNIPLKRRVITFGVERSKECMVVVRKKVDLCRVWLNEFERLHVSNKKIITLPEKYISGSQESDIELDPSDPCESD